MLRDAKASTTQRRLLGPEYWGLAVSSAQGPDLRAAQEYLILHARCLDRNGLSAGNTSALHYKCFKFSLTVVLFKSAFHILLITAFTLIHPLFSSPLFLVFFHLQLAL